jgi:hypothetical protein
VIAVAGPILVRYGGFLSNYFAPCSEPIFEVVTVFIAPFLEKSICTGTNYVLGQFEGGNICNFTSHGTPSVGVLWESGY